MCIVLNMAFVSPPINNILLLILRLDGVSSRFQETSAEFEQARNKARKAKIEFETVKKNRLVTLCFVFYLS